MSHQYYNGLWAEAQQEFRAIIQDERRVIPEPDQEDHVKLFEFLADLYMKYVQVFKKLDEAYDQIVHPQKRPLLRKLLDLSIVRILEIREAMTDTELSNFSYFDDILQWMHWVPEDYEINTPKYYIHERGPEFALRQEWLEGAHLKRLTEDDIAFAVIKDSDDEGSLLFKPDFEEEVGLSFERAIRLIQTAERARQGRARYEMAKFIYEEEERVRGKKKRQKQQLMDPEKAAVIIQRLIRRFISSRRVQRRRNQELEFLGLSFSRHRTNTMMGKKISEAEKWRQKIQAHADTRRQLQRRYQQDYLEAQNILENRLRVLETPEMIEQMKFQLRQYILEAKERTGRLPDMPKADLGGSGFIFVQEKHMDQMTVTSEKAMSPSLPGSSKNSSAKRKTKKSNKEPKREKEQKTVKDNSNADAAPGGGVFKAPHHFEKMLEANYEYNMNWRLRSEVHNPDQHHEDSIIIEEKRQQIQMEVRSQVDILMKAELLLLRESLEKRKGKKGKKQKSGRSGKGSKKGKKKKKRVKDLTPDRTLESLYTELIVNGVIRKYPKVRFEDLVGECSLVNGTIRRHHALALQSHSLDEPDRPTFPKNPHPPPSFGDIKRAVKDLCVLPMGSLTVHQMAPFTKSLLIAGPQGSGKKSLVYAVCTELSATLFDLTPANIAGKYPGKPGLNMLMHLIGKVGRLAQPSILFIDDCEKTYQKRVPKTDKTEPKRLKRHLAKFIKSISADDQIMLIACSAEPWVANIKLLKKDYQKIIYIPKPDHGDRIAMWRNLLEPHYNELHQDVQLSLLAKLSDGWTLGTVSRVVKTITQRHYDAMDRERRYRSQSSGADRGKSMKISRVGRKLIRLDDILAEISTLDPLFFEQEKLWNSWFSKTPLQRARLTIFEAVTDTEKPKSKPKKNKAK